MTAQAPPRSVRRPVLDGWLTATTIVVVIAVALPLIAIITLAFSPDENIWPHLIHTVLPGYIWRTLFLLTGVGVLVASMGTLTAWLVASYEFPLRRYFHWISLLPLAMPVYITSYTYVAFLNYSGPVQTALRDLFGWQSRQDYWFPEIRSLPGAVLVLATVLYPYVFMTAQAAFMRMPTSQLDAARSLGRGPVAVFFKIALPQARPAIVVGMSLALMEVLNDIAAVNFFGVNTLTLGIFNTLQIDGNLGGAAQLSCVLLLFVFAVLWFEQHGLRRQEDFTYQGTAKLSRRGQLQGWRGIVCMGLCAMPVIVGFAIPAIVLLRFAIRRFSSLDVSAYADATRHTLALASVSAIVVVVVGLILAYATRRSTPALRPLLKFATLGYAVPGTLLGIGILVPFSAFDNRFHLFMQDGFGINTGALLSGTMVALVFAYTIRFLAISYGTLLSGLEKITPNVTAASRILGRTAFQTFARIHLPMLRPAIVTAALLVFVDSMKELPATLILRPFDFETLATLVFNLASLDQLEESAIPALTIVAAGIVPVLLLARNLRDPWFKP